MISKALSQRVLTIEQIAEIAEVSIDYVLLVQSERKRKRNAELSDMPITYDISKGIKGLLGRFPRKKEE